MYRPTPYSSGVPLDLLDVGVLHLLLYPGPVMVLGGMGKGPSNPPIMGLLSGSPFLCIPLGCLALGVTTLGCWIAHQDPSFCLLLVFLHLA